jgi:hypothetical protein
MPQNNPALYTAVIAGATGGSVAGRWITDITPVDYQGLVNAVVAIATEVDSQIPGINSGPSLSQILLLQSITQGVFVDRNPQDIITADYLAIAKAIAALFIQASSAAAPIPTILAMGHIHDDGTPDGSGIVIVTEYNVASVVYSVPLSGPPGIPGFYTIQFKNPINLDHCDFPATYHSDVTDPTDLSDLGFMFEINYTSPTALSYCRYDLTDTGGPEAGDFSFHVVGLP